MMAARANSPVDAGPQRRCIACRKALERERSIRFVVDPNGRVVVDSSQKAPGRGARTCPSATCILKAVKRAAFGRAFSRQVEVPEPATLVATARDAARRRVHESLGLLRRQGGLVLGARAVLESLEHNASGLALVVVATDHSPRSASDLARRAGQSKVAVARYSTAAAIGSSIGRPPTGVVGAPVSGLAKRLAVEVSKANMLDVGVKLDSPQTRKDGV